MLAVDGRKNSLLCCVDRPGEVAALELRAFEVIGCDRSGPGHGDLVEASRKAISRLHGAYSLVIFSHDEPDLLIGARLNAPLMVGLGNKEWFICSDLTGIIPYTKKALVLGEGQMVAITKLGPVVTDLLSGS